ncbi:hypothetical protein N1851_025862 [Merluccius polli]|uniref:Uncharacterized protein n=1 Tax=Merluccius polli TaxID=89951 RepID=A0AA47MCW2_MERPO|nr:hypothetical protein N1851_025862 [Merluccius polli]
MSDSKQGRQVIRPRDKQAGLVVHQQSKRTGTVRNLRIQFSRPLDSLDANTQTGQAESEGKWTVQTVRNLGVLFDHMLSFDQHVKSITRTAFFHLRNIAKIRPMLSTADAEMLIHANQKTLTLSSLHWLPINASHSGLQELASQFQKLKRNQQETAFSYRNDLKPTSLRSHLAPRTGRQWPAVRQYSSIDREKGHQNIAAAGPRPRRDQPSGPGPSAGQLIQATATHDVRLPGTLTVRLDSAACQARLPAKNDYVPVSHTRSHMNKHTNTCTHTDTH